jgi:hypothetical protein
MLPLPAAIQQPAGNVPALRRDGEGLNIVLDRLLLQAAWFFRLRLPTAAMRGNARRRALMTKVRERTVKA